VEAGKQITLVSYGRTLPLCVQVAKKQQSIAVEVVDMRTLWPYDCNTGS
jgi:2-oxoisovalerate dehydrogenase E1 component beta subunit